MLLTGSFVSCSFGAFFSESGACPSRQMRNRSLSPGGFNRFLDVPLRSGSLLPGWHISSKKSSRIEATRQTVLAIHDRAAVWM
jgi:hypothetical protein